MLLRRNRDQLGQQPIDALLAVLRRFGWRGWLATAVTAVASAVVIGIPTVLIGNPWYSRMTPTRPQDYVIWLLTALLFGVHLGTYALGRAGGTGGTAVTGSVLTFFAVGCPICNKLVVLLLGVSGALTVFGPAQLFIGIASLALLGWALLLRARALTTTNCLVPRGAG